MSWISLQQLCVSFELSILIHFAERSFELWPNLWAGGDDHWGKTTAQKEEAAGKAELQEGERTAGTGPSTACECEHRNLTS